MKNKLTIWLVVFCPLSLSGQNIDSLVRSIRSEYNLIIKNKESYKKTVLNIDNSEEPIYEDGHYIDAGAFKEEIITYYMDEKDNQIKLISLYEAEILNYNIWAKLTEYYFKDGNLFFIYRQIKNVSGNESFDIEDMLATAIEERVYVTGVVDYIETNNCVRYLLKSVKGKLSDVNELLRKSVNINTDCSKFTETIYHSSVKKLVDIIYGQDESVKISKELPPMYYYNILFGK